MKEGRKEGVEWSASIVVVQGSDRVLVRFMACHARVCVCVCVCVAEHSRCNTNSKVIERLIVFTFFVAT